MKVTTRLVEIGVVAHRGNGVAAGLTKDDFQVFDNGKEQRIATFAASEAKANSSSANGAVNPNVFSNRTDRGTVGVTIILLDSLNTATADQSRAKDQLREALDHVQASSPVAVYVLSTRLVVLHDFTQDMPSLRKTLDQYRSGALPVLSPNGAGAAERAFQLRTIVERTIAALEAIALHIKAIPGRKNLIWISGSFPVTIRLGAIPESFRPETERLARELSDADVAVYPISTRGLADQTSVAANRNSSGRALSTPSLAAPPAMAILADETGGKPYHNTNDLATAITHALGDSEATYVLGFYVDEAQLDNRMHELKVHVKAHGVNVRYRRGYFAMPEVELTDQQREAQLKNALESPLESTGIAMKVRIDPSDQPTPGSARLVVGIDLKTLSLIRKGDQYVGAAELMMVQQSSNGERLKTTDETIRLKLAEQEYTRMLTDGLVLVKYIEPAPDAFQIRVFVLDGNSGSLGSVYIPVIRSAN